MTYIRRDQSFEISSRKWMVTTHFQILNEIFSDQDRLSALTQVFEEAESDIDAAQASGSNKAVEAIPEASRAAGTDLGQILNRLASFWNRRKHLML